MFSKILNDVVLTPDILFFFKIANLNMYCKMHSNSVTEPF